MGVEGSKSLDAGIQNDVWYYLVLTYNQNETNEVKLYLNGILIAEWCDWGGLLDTSNSPFSIGIANVDRGDPLGDFDGIIDDVRIYEFALSPQQVKSLYNNGFGDNNTLDAPTEQYRIIDMTTGFTSEWRAFTYKEFSILNDLGELSNNFTIEYKVVDHAGNENTTKIYNNNYENIRFSKEKSISLSNDTIDLNDAQNREISFENTGQFNDIESLDAYVNGFYYGTAYLDSGYYKLSFGAENSKDTLIAYSDSIMSEYIYSNINPMNHISWEVREDNLFAVVKHVLVDEDIVIINPLTYNATATLELEHLYDRGFGLTNYVRLKNVYYFNTSSGTAFHLNFAEDYSVDSKGFITFPETSCIHNLYENSSEVRDNLIYFGYDASSVYDQLKLSNADGFFVNFTLPAIYYEHTAIEKLTINFNDFSGNTFSKVYWDFDLRKFFLNKEDYEVDLFGLGKMMKIPLYIDMGEIAFSNPHNIFDPSLLESISFTIADSERWPGSFIQEFEEYSVLNLPYQRVGISDLTLYNLISDSIEADEQGFVNSTVMFRASDYYGFYSEAEFKIKRLDIEFTDLKVYLNEQQISDSSNVDIEYSDFIELNYRFNNTLAPVVLNDIVILPVALTNASAGELEVLSSANAYWITKLDRDSLSGYYTSYYYSRIQVPVMLGEFNVSFGSLGTPLFNISFVDVLSFTLNITQELIDEVEPIYLAQDTYEVEYGHSLLLEGCVRDNDEYLVLDEVYEYRYQEALDGRTVHHLDFVSPFGDDEYIDKEEFAIYYVNNASEIIPLYSNLYGNYYKNSTILDYNRNPQISYVDNAFLLNIYWEENSIDFIHYDTQLLISYKVVKGRPISPISYSSVDSYGNNLEQNLIEIPFAKYDMLSRIWFTEDDFIEQLMVDKVLLIEDVENTDAILQGPQYYDGKFIQTGVINLEGVYVNWSDSYIFELLNESEYSWNIKANGELNVSGLPYSSGDVFKVAYYGLNPVPITHSINNSVSSIDTIKVVNKTGFEYEFQLDTDYVISADGYKLYFKNLFNTILKSGNFTIYDFFEIQYHSSLSRKIDLSQNLLLLLQDSQGNDIPIDNVPIDNLGFFEYEQTLREDSPLSIPLGSGKQLVRMTLKYLPVNVFNKSAEQLVDIDYTDPTVGKIYPYKESNSWSKPFTIITIPSRVKLEMIEDPSQDILITQRFYEEREYFFNFNPVEALEAGEEYTKVMIDALAQENYTFTFRLTNFENKPVNNSIVWLHLGFMPKSKSGFLNDRAIVDDLGVSPYFEALGTEEITFRGPGEGPSKMFGRPLTYELENYYDNFSTWGPYVWLYAVTDEFGEVSFDITFEEDYLEAFTDIFGSIEGISSVEDMIFYIRAFSNYFDWEDMAIDTPEQYLCSNDGQVFDGTTMLSNYSFNELAVQDSTYVEGLVRLYKGDIALGINDYYSYNLPDSDTDSTYDPLTLHLYVNEADPIPTTATTTLESLTKVYSSSELEPQPYSILLDDYTYYARIQFYTPSGNLVETLYKEIHEGYNSGIIEIDNETVYDLLVKLGPGISTIKVQVAESEYYKASPIVIVPLEIVPAYHIRFGQKNSIIDLIDPFVSAWGTANNNGEEMVFESNYPHLIGSIWVEPFYNETGDELSIQDYIEIALDCTIYNDDGTTSTFPLENEVMLRPGNWDGVMTFDTGLGPESAFLMGLQCDLNLSFSIDFNKEQIFEELRDVEIYLLDLRLEANPSSSTPNITWSIYDDGFSSSEITVETIEDTIDTETGVLYLGGTQNGQDYGQGISFIFNNGTLEYGLDADSELLNLLALNEIVALKVLGIKDGNEYEFEQGTDWTMPYYPSGILANDSVISFTETNLPDEGSEFSVVYKLKFDFGSNYFGKVSLGYTNSYNESSVELQLPSGFLPVSNNSYSPMFIRFNQTCDGTTTEYTLDYGRQSAVVSDFIIYNEEELEVLNNNNSIGKTIVNNHLKITFGQAPGSPFEVLYGVRSLYDLGYGFQKVNKSYSDSVRLIYNEDTSSKLLDNLSNQLSSYDLKDPSLYISLDDSNETTTLKLLNVPLLYAPEINITFKFDHVLLDLIDTFNDLFNNLTIEFKYITNDGFYEFYSDPIVIPLNYSEISLDIIEDSYSIYYNKDLQAIYDMVGVDNLDIEITLRQVGESNRFIPYIILEQYDYLTDTHLVENYDRRPLDKYGDFDINAAVNTPHYYQAFALPLVDCVYGDSPFNLIDGSEITVGLQSLPNATLVSVDSDGENYDFDFWGDSITLPVNAENFYMIPNLGMFVDTYDIEQPLYQDGYLDLYYGSGTEVDGEEQYTATIFMDYEGDWIADYQSYISDKTPTSWENTYDFADQFITTDIITVEGRVFYHQVFDLDIDTNSSSVMNDIFPDSQYIHFGVELPEGLDIDEIRSVGDPYMYSLSVQGFPIGKYKEEYCSMEPYYSGSFDPIQDVLDDDDFALEYDENGTAYMLFFKPMGELGSYTDDQNKIMIDYWVNHEFMQNYDYYIHEDPEDPYISQIEWDYSFIDENSFRLHPDFNDEVSFTVEYSALEWEIFNQLYIEDGIDIFTFQPKEYYNVSVLYTGESSTDVFSIQYIVPEDQYKEDHLLFPTIYVLAQLGDDEATMRVLEVYNDPGKSFIVQNAPDSYNYTIDFAEIETYIQSLYDPNYQLVENSYLYVLAKYDSILLRYQMEHTPFNYKYLGEDHDVYHVGLFIDDEFIAYSNETAFHDYVLKIENGYIYFNNKSQGQPGYIDPQSKIKLEYKFKLQPGLLDRKHFLVVTYPWTNVFENSILDPINTEKYRKLSGGSIITPFEYSLSIDNKYSLYLSYRLNEREYYEEAFEISAEYFDSSKNGYVYEFISQELDNYVDVLNIDGEDLINIYYFDRFNEMRFLDPSHYIVNIGSRQIIIKNDENPLALQNRISKFYVSFIPKSNDLEFASYRFSYDPTLKITETLNILYWDVIGLEGIDVIPNLNAHYFINEGESSADNYMCHASQLAVYLNEGEELEFNLEGELNDFDEDVLTAIHNGDYLSLYFDTNMKNIESLEYLSIELYDNVGLMSGFTQNITRSELEMWDYNIKVDLPTTANSLKKIRFVPIFRTDSEYNNDNTIGIARIQTALWDSEFASFMEDGQEYMHVDLEFDLKTELDGFELAYIFNDKLQYLTFLEDFSINYTKDMDIYTLHIPSVYLDPDTNATVHFREEQTIVIRYNSPVKRGLALGIGKMYLEYKGYNYDSHPDIPKAEFMLVETSSSDTYSEFTSDYYYQTPLQLTPFDTEYNNRFKTVKIDLNLTALYESTSSSLLNFTHLLFSVPNPSYELTINEVLIIEESSKPTIQSGSMDNRVWQYTEVELFTATKNPEQDSYQLTLENTPLFYPDSKWLDYLNIYDENGNYYTAGLTGNDHQLLFEPSNNTFTWNPSFNQYPEYFGMEFEEPLIIEANKTLYFGYVINTSWAEPIRIEVENIDLDSIRVIYDYNYLLKPEHYDWYIQNYNAAHSYENIAYSFKEEIEYRVVQYYYESFAVYSDISQYNHTFDIGDLSFEDDFVNLSLYKVIGLTPTFDSEILTDNDDFTVEFNEAAKTLTITDLNVTNGYLNVFDQITVILNYSYAPISSFSEIFLLDEFNQTYLADIEDTFYSYVDIDYRFLTTTGVLFAESSTAIISDLTSFEAIDYCQNPYINDNNKLIGYGSELFDNFEIYQDESSIIYTSDIDMDREPDYKHTIDVNKDGKVDVIRYGINDPQGSGEIYWHTVIQDFESVQVNIKQEQPEELRTEWFDLDDRTFAKYDFNVVKLIAVVLALPLLSYHITKMVLPDVDYWAQKSTQQLITQEEHVKSDFYSVKVDENRDGIPDSQIDYEKVTVDVYYTVDEHRETVLAAKRQNIFSYLASYVASSFRSLFGGSKEDSVFNEELTKEILESQDFSTCGGRVRDNAGVLRSTFRKVTQDITTTYIDTFEQAAMTIIDYNEEGDIEEKRVYRDDFENYEVNIADRFFSGLAAQHLVTNIDTGQQYPVQFDPELPFSHPANISWDTTTWGPDQISVKYDSLQVFGGDDSYTTNVFEETIILRIPNRYSLYHDFGKSSKANVVDDGWVEFEVSGMLITPQDGRVYYTSDIQSFMSGKGKVDGHYFFVDSDQNSYYETVYILSDISTISSSDIPMYDVISIGYNYDGVHDFVPYERLNKKERITSDFSSLAREKAKFGSDWVYNFKKLDGNELLWDEESIWDRYKPKDQIFEIHKLIEPSEKNRRFSKLFYEVRHEAYSNAWKQYRKQLISDIVEQVFMSATATFLSAAVHTLVSWIPFGIGPALAEVLRPITYFLTYTLMTKFFIDIKLHEAQSRMRSDTFYPVSSEVDKPTTLNHRSKFDRILKDSMAAALIGHPGGYYTTVSGGEPGNMYTGEILVSPPNYARMKGSLKGLLDLLWENLLNMGESDPDVYRALDFDNKNLNYLLLTSELPAYNHRDSYTYENTNKLFDLYDEYYGNTLGFLESKIKSSSDNLLDMIRATCVDGRPHYEFINSTVYGPVMPQLVLYNPIVLSEQWYNQLQPDLGHLTIKVQCPECAGSSGMGAYNMSYVENQAGYKAKIPLFGNGFEYPINHISIDFVKSHSQDGVGYFAQDLIVNESYYSIDSGNLYFTLPVEEIVSEKYQLHDDVLQEIKIGSYADSNIYYDMHIYFDIFIPDTTEETHNLALAQATSYAIMDYFNQYTYAEVTANMISEIAYTESVTFWSTLISAPLMWFGSWTTKGTETALGQAGSKSIGAVIAKGMAQVITTPIKEVFEEIIKDGFIEAFAEGLTDIMGWAEDVGFWISSMATSGRETVGSLGKIALGKTGIKANFKNAVALSRAVASGDMKAVADIQQKIKQEAQQQLELAQQREQDKTMWQKLIGSNFFKGFTMMLPGLFVGTFDFLSFAGLTNMLAGAINIVPSAYAHYRAKIQAYKSNKITKIVGDKALYSYDSLIK